MHVEMAGDFRQDARQRPGRQKRGGAAAEINGLDLGPAEIVLAEQDRRTDHSRVRKGAENSGFAFGLGAGVGHVGPGIRAQG